jgi:hypothetical protein
MDYRVRPATQLHFPERGADHGKRAHVYLAPLLNCGNGNAGTGIGPPRFIRMFFFFTNRIGLSGSILVSILLSLVLLYACTRA